MFIITCSNCWNRAILKGSADTLSQVYIQINMVDPLIQRRQYLAIKKKRLIANSTFKPPLSLPWLIPTPSREGGSKRRPEGQCGEEEADPNLLAFPLEIFSVFWNSKVWSQICRGGVENFHSGNEHHGLFDDNLNLNANSLNVWFPSQALAWHRIATIFILYWRPTTGAMEIDGVRCKGYLDPASCALRHSCRVRICAETKPMWYMCLILKYL